MSNNDNANKTDGANTPERFTLTKQDILYILGNSLVAMLFIFGLNYFALKTPMQTALMWTAMFGAIAFTMAFRHVKQKR
jgi:hypothetical protein